MLRTEEEANKVRMLMRTDMGHESVCTLARDRIASLARERDQLREFVERLARGEITARAQSSVMAANDLLNHITRERSTAHYAGLRSPQAHSPQDDTLKGIDP